MWECMLKVRACLSLSLVVCVQFKPERTEIFSVSFTAVGRYYYMISILCGNFISFIFKSFLHSFSIRILAVNNG